MDIQAPEIIKKKKNIRPGRKDGRPRKEINFDQVKSMCQVMCTQDEICAILEISPDILCRRCQELYGCTFADYYKKNSSHGKASLRRTMYKKAIEDNDTTMQIWLSKAQLGMHEKLDINNTYEPLVIEYEDGSKKEIRVDKK